MKILTVKLCDPLFPQIDVAAKARNASKSEIVRERIARRDGATQTSKKSFWSRMEDLVIQGDSLARDLSANKTHLNNYGKKRPD